MIFNRSRAGLRVNNVWNTNGSSRQCENRLHTVYYTIRSEEGKKALPDGAIACLKFWETCLIAFFFSGKKINTTQANLQQRNVA